MRAQPSEEHYQNLFGAYHRKDGDVRALRRLYLLEMIDKVKNLQPHPMFGAHTLYLRELHDRIEYLLGFPMVPDQEDLREQLREGSE